MRILATLLSLYNPARYVSLCKILFQNESFSMYFILLFSKERDNSNSTYKLYIHRKIYNNLHLFIKSFV